MNKYQFSHFSIDWILVDELAIGPAPKKEKHLEILENSNIKSILSLCSPDESPPPTDMSSRFICRRSILPDHSYGRDPTLEELKNALNTLINLTSLGPVFVHCLAGVERSPLVCISYLVQERRIPLDKALDYVMRVHPGTSPLSSQLNMIKNL